VDLALAVVIAFLAAYLYLAYRDWVWSPGWLQRIVRDEKKRGRFPRSRDMENSGCRTGGCGSDHDRGRANLRDDRAADGIQSLRVNHLKEVSGKP
jgi:hypothetical protein